MTMPKSAMILAAGRGERMRPLTDTCPKPLIEVAGKTMLERAYTHVKNAGIQNCVVNAHYLASQIQNAAQHYAQVSIEAALLDTAGGVLNALPLLQSDPFFVLNGDVVWLDPTHSWLQKMGGAWASHMKSLLMLVPKECAHGYEGRGDFFCDDQGRLRRPHLGEEAPYIYGGVQIVTKSSFEGYPIPASSTPPNKQKNSLLPSSRKSSESPGLPGAEDDYPGSTLKPHHGSRISASPSKQSLGSSSFRDDEEDELSFFEILRPFSFNKIWDDLMESGTLYGTVFKGEWYHIGTPETLEKYAPIIRGKEESLTYGRPL